MHTAVTRLWAHEREVFDIGRLLGQLHTLFVWAGMFVVGWCMTP